MLAELTSMYFPPPLRMILSKIALFSLWSYGILFCEVRQHRPEKGEGVGQTHVRKAMLEPTVEYFANISHCVKQKLWRWTLASSREHNTITWERESGGWGRVVVWVRVRLCRVLALVHVVPYHVPEHENHPQQRPFYRSGCRLKNETQTDLTTIFKPVLA